MSYTDEDRRGILKGQSLNIAFQGFDAYEKDEIKSRIETAHEIFNELMRQKFLLW